MEATGYDHTDWKLNQEQVIEPKFASMYIQNLVSISNGSHNFIKSLVVYLQQRLRMYRKLCNWQSILSTGGEDGLAEKDLS
jgi:hypothetical protein